MRAPIAVAILTVACSAPGAPPGQERDSPPDGYSRAASSLAEEAETLAAAEALAREEAANRGREEDGNGGAPSGWFSLRRLFGGRPRPGAGTEPPIPAPVPVTIRETASLPIAAPFPLPASAEPGEDERGEGLAGMLLGDARALAERGDCDGAIAVLTALLERAPDSSEAWRARGGLLLAEGEYRRAVGDYRRAIAAGGGDIDSRYGLGTALEKWAETLDAEGAGEEAAERYRAAAAEYKAVLWKRPDYPPACYSLGCVCARMHKRDDAVHYFRKTLEQAENDSELARCARYNMKLLGEY
jgi:tetratricopeptide (TPR) repeat protein